MPEVEEAWKEQQEEGRSACQPPPPPENLMLEEDWSAWSMSTSLTPLSCQGLSQLPRWGGLSPRRRMAACLSLPPHLDLLGSRQTLLKPIKVSVFLTSYL